MGVQACMRLVCVWVGLHSQYDGEQYGRWSSMGEWAYGSSSIWECMGATTWEQQYMESYYMWGSTWEDQARSQHAAMPHLTLQMIKSVNPQCREFANLSFKMSQLHCPQCRELANLSIKMSHLHCPRCTEFANLSIKMSHCIAFVRAKHIWAPVSEWQLSSFSDFQLHEHRRKPFLPCPLKKEAN